MSAIVIRHDYAIVKISIGFQAQTDIQEFYYTTFQNL